MKDIDKLNNFLKESIEAKEQFVNTHAHTFFNMATSLIERLKAGKMIFIVGNGGSAADAQHFAAELVGRFEQERKALKCIALTTDTSVLTALSNDHGFNTVFERQIEALGKSGDVLIAISTSGNSSNILYAATKAKTIGLYVVGLTGKGGGKLKNMVDVLLDVPIDVSIPRIQEVHIFALHVLAYKIEEAFSLP